MNIFSSYSPKGMARGSVAANGETRLVEDNRIPLYIIYIIDTSGSMKGYALVRSETGELIRITKIEQLNKAIKVLLKTLKDFEDNNPLYKVYVQFIELNSYGKAVFPTFQSLSRGFEEIEFEADGCTVLRSSLGTLKEFVNDKHLRDERTGKGTNRAVSVILMSDGWPTDCNGIEQDGPAYRGVIDETNQYFRDKGYARNMDFYSVAVGEDACEDMLRYFCDGDNTSEEKQSRFYRVENCESIANALDLVTRATLAHHTTIFFDDYSDDDSTTDDSSDNTADNSDTDTVDNSTGDGLDNKTGDTSSSVVSIHATETDESLDGLFDGIE